MDNTFLYPAYVVLLMFVSSLVKDAKNEMLIAGVGLLLVYPNIEMASFIMLFILPVAILSSFGNK